MEGAGQKTVDVIVVGGGPAGMMAAYAAARRGLAVTLLEKNEKLGKKLYITGKGRCNLTNAAGAGSFFSAQRTNPKFLYSAFHHFSNSDLCDLMEAYGLRLKVERGDRVFPVSDHASDVTGTLTKMLSETGVTIKLSTRVSDIKKSADMISVRTKDGVILAHSVIVATGGLSYPQTGSTGDGYAFAESFGLMLTPRAPSLCSLKVADAMECAETAGLTLKNAGFRLMAAGGRLLYEDMGEILFTHTGLSGPLALTASAYVAGTGSSDLTAHIDLKPALSQEVLDKRLLREIELAGDKELKNFMRRLLPNSIIPLVIRRAGLDPFSRSGDLRRGERLSLEGVIKDLSFNVTGTGGFDEAIVTRGGVSVAELDPRTMECRKVPGLYFAGEVIDIDALTGGFNLQNAFSTGFTAGDSV